MSDSFDYDSNPMACTEFVDINARTMNTLKFKRLVSSLPLNAGPVLDIGCGGGQILRSLGSVRNDLELFGCDISGTAIDYARTFNDGINYTVANAEKLPYPDNHFDFLIAMDIFEHVEDPEQLLAEINRIGKSNSMVFGHIPCEDNIGTVYWVFRKLNLALSTYKTRKAGHIHYFRKNDFLRICKANGLVPRKTEYSYHPFGQFMDVFTYIGKRSHQAAAESSSEKTNRFHATLKSVKNLLLLKMESISYYESLFLRNIPLAMNIDVLFRLKK